MKIDDLLEKFGLKYEELTKVEKETLHNWLNAIENNTITIPKIKEYISQMKSSVEQELCRENLNKNQDIFLKARLRNYLLLEAFFSTPEKAKNMLEMMLSRIKS